jgi:hypothetical protein
LAGAMQLHRRLARQRVGIVLSGGNITSAQLLRILHGEVLSGAVKGVPLPDPIATMEFGERFMSNASTGMTPQ